MRIRNVKGASLKIEKSPYMILNEKDWKGRFQSLFENENPIHVEIGMGKGDFIIENAKRYPNINFVGIEKFDSIVVRAIDKVKDLNLPNLRFIRMDATQIEEVFEKEVDMIYLNFSDPWPKNRHENRRLTSKIFLHRYDSLFKGTKRIRMKTDNRHLFEFSLVELIEYGYHIESVCLNVYEEGVLNNIPTEYEKKFHARGLPIYFLEVSKDN